MKKNLLEGLPSAASEECFEALVKGKGLVLERIVSKGQRTPPGEWLSGERDEWVMLARGAAKLVFEKGGEVGLGPGDFLTIPAGARHRVEWTDPGRETVWLALHYQPAETATAEGDGGEGRIQRVKVIRSSRRKRTAGARLYGGTMYVYVPQRMAEREVRQMVATFTARFEKIMLRRKLNGGKSLRQVAEELNARYFGGSLKIDSIQYVTDQTSKFGCCNCTTRSIRISHVLATMPEWVRDYVIMHEICHLREPGHGKEFWDLVRRYPLAERARGYLLAKGVEPDDGE